MTLQYVGNAKNPLPTVQGTNLINIRFLATGAKVSCGIRDVASG